MEWHVKYRGRECEGMEKARAKGDGNEQEGEASECDELGEVYKNMVGSPQH